MCTSSNAFLQYSLVTMAYYCNRVVYSTDCCWGENTSVVPPPLRTGLIQRVYKQIQIESGVPGPRVCHCLKTGDSHRRSIS